MVFVKSQSYTDGFGNKSRNIVSLEGVLNYKIVEREDGLFDVYIPFGDASNFLYTINDEEKGIKMLQNLFTFHKSNDAFQIVDIEAFMFDEVEESEVEIEDCLNLMCEVLTHLGYDELVKAYESKVEQLMDDENVTYEDDKIIVNCNPTRENPPQTNEITTNKILTPIKNPTPDISYH